jgi:RNA polymerase sigma-70 factor (ECF subfamily)
LEPSVSISQLSDEQLVSEIIKTKNSKLFAVLYDRYAPLVYNKCLGFAKNKVEAEDLTHDIFIKLYIKLKSFKGTAKFSTWLYSFTYNFCVNYVQRDAYKNKEQVNEEAVEKRSAVIDEVSDEDIFQLKAEKLQRVMSIIDPKDKMILLMKYQDDLSIKEISEALELGESAVKMRLKRAKEKVMETYKKL